MLIDRLNMSKPSHIKLKSIYALWVGRVIFTMSLTNVTIITKPWKHDAVRHKHFSIDCIYGKDTWPTHLSQSPFNRPGKMFSLISNAWRHFMRVTMATTVMSRHNKITNNIARMIFNAIIKTKSLSSLTISRTVSSNTSTVLKGTHTHTSITQAQRVPTVVMYHARLQDV